MHKWERSDSFPYVITLFSAPNYCGVYQNKAAVLTLKNNNIQIKQYKVTEGPYLLPDGHNLFSFTMPFLKEKMAETLHHLL